MAKSFDQNERTPAVSDDLIKDALKTGLSNIHASDDLIRETLAACRNEIQAEERKVTKKAPWPWVVKIGAPLAAGALVCVLMLNTPYMKSANNATGAGADSARSSDMVMEQNGEVNIMFSEKVQDAASQEEPVTSSAPIESKAFANVNGSDVVFGTAYSHNIEGLYSATNRTVDEYEPDDAKLMEHFESIVTQYNTVQGTQFTLFSTGVTRVETLVETGVTADMLQNMTDYHELLSGKGYWLLPLKNSDGVLEDVITVNTMEAQNKELVVTSYDFVFSTNNYRFLVSPHSSGALVAKNCELMFDASNLVSEVKAKGYKNISDMTILDINYGMDFLVMFKGDGKQLAIPFVLDQELYGLENQRIYPSEELIGTLIEKMLK